MKKKVLTEEQKKQLYGLMPFLGDATVPYTPDVYKNVDEKIRPVFFIRPFTKKEQLKMKDLFKDLSKLKQEVLIDLLSRCVIGWKNVFDLTTGEEIVYKADSDGGIEPYLLKSIPESIITKLITFVSRISGLIDVEVLGLNY